jgi:CRISPR-associated protein Cmr5
MSQTLDQRRAAHAWNAVENMAAPDKSKEEKDDYAGEAKKLPSRIFAAGLGQALAFIVAKTEKKTALRQLHQDITSWVVGERPMPQARHRESLLESVINGDSEFLRVATAETLAYLNWLNRFAEAVGLKSK